MWQKFPNSCRRYKEEWEVSLPLSLHWSATAVKLGNQRRGKFIATKLPTEPETKRLKCVKFEFKLPQQFDQTLLILAMSQTEFSPANAWVSIQKKEHLPFPFCFGGGYCPWQVSDFLCSKMDFQLVARAVCPTLPWSDIDSQNNKRMLHLHSRFVACHSGCGVTWFEEKRHIVNIVSNCKQLIITR